MVMEEEEEEEEKKSKRKRENWKWRGRNKKKKEKGEEKERHKKPHTQEPSAKQNHYQIILSWHMKLFIFYISQIE